MFEPEIGSVSRDLVPPVEEAAEARNGVEPEIGSVSPDLVPPVEEAAEARNGVGAVAAELQRTCITVLRAGWSTLAVVAMDAQMPARELADALVETARAYRLRTVRALHADGAGAHVLDALAEAKGGDARTVITVEDPLANPHCMPLAVAADAAVFIVRLGTSTIDSVDAMAEMVGRERVLGCVVLRR